MGPLQGGHICVRTPTARPSPQTKWSVGGCRWAGNGMPTQSSVLANGQPTHCAFEPCNKEFAEICFHAADGRYYCSEECAVEAANFRLSRIDNLGRRSHKAL